jgi:hypothetical protein
VEYGWLMPVILATWEAEIRRIMVPGQHKQNSSRDPISTDKIRAWWHNLLPIIPAMAGNLK